MLELFPRLAAFPLPPRRTPEQIWRGDAELLKEWARGELPQAVLRVALSGERVVGIAFAQPRPEALSGRPAVHLEALLVAEDYQGRGIARALVTAVEEQARELGMTAVTLNVFMLNERARGLYRSLGYDEELLRCIKDL